jgi:hypothetical protein
MHIRGTGKMPRAHLTETRRMVVKGVLIVAGCYSSPNIYLDALGTVTPTNYTVTVTVAAGSRAS